MQMLTIYLTDYYQYSTSTMVFIKINQLINN